MSVITARINLIERKNEFVDRGHTATGVFMELSKAFDSVHHMELLSTLENLGVTCRRLNRFKSNIEDRKQFADVNKVENSNQLIIQIFSNGNFNLLFF